MRVVVLDAEKRDEPLIQRTKVGRHSANVLGRGGGGRGAKKCPAFLFVAVVDLDQIFPSLDWTFKLNYLDN